MQIILLEKVINLGNLGDVVKVKDGYARNFLIPKRMAKRATPAAMAEFEVRRIELEKIAADKLAAAQGVADKMAGQLGGLRRRHSRRLHHRGTSRAGRRPHHRSRAQRLPSLAQLPFGQGIGRARDEAAGRCQADIVFTTIDQGQERGTAKACRGHRAGPLR